ncbi:MAG TPA: M20/M25/M40 family metallo-hydrolase [Thermoanaerobaculia bacterium]|nr:M20/M25/M40 family metallo-hydrolase [Thermoanaerobaculia bacterium]
MSVRRAAALAVALSLSFLVALPAPAAPPENVDLEMVTRIRDEAFNRSKAAETLSKLCDGMGPRLTGSPDYRKAAEWARDQMTAIGLSNVKIESFAPFGRGWILEAASVRMVAPAVAILPGLPKAWTPGTDGPKKGKAVLGKLETAEDLEKWKGKLEGKILLLGDPPEARPHDKGDVSRYDDKELAEIWKYEPGGGRYRRSPADRERMIRQREFRKKLDEFLRTEKVLAVLEPSRGDYGTIFVQGGGSWKPNEPVPPPTVVLGAEAYGRVARILERKGDVELEVDVQARFTDEDPLAASNVFGEIPGTDRTRKDEIVLIGAHLDSWHGGTGATDDGVGVATALEVMRILKALNVAPKRTIRIGLWGGEEQGLLGSRAWVSRELASRLEPTDARELELPAYLRRPTGPLSFKPGYAKFDVYFNVDNGAGKLRGIFAQDNAAVVPIFEAWLAPFRDLGATTVTMKRTGGTDHQSFDSVGLPGFQFLQDELDYDTRTHHANMDVVERVPKADLMEIAAVWAAFAWHAAQRDPMFPRRPLPPEPPAEPTKPPAETPEAPARQVTSGHSRN